MKKSKIFWITAYIIFLIWYDFFWYNSYKTERCMSEQFLIEGWGVIFNLYFLVPTLIYLIPKFNKWLDK